MHSDIYETLQCSCVAEIYGQLGGGELGSVCHGHMCILLYMKLIQCNGVAEIYGQLEEGWGLSDMGKCTFCYI